jgi:hypothetical protein
MKFIKKSINQTTLKKIFCQILNGFHQLTNSVKTYLTVIIFQQVTVHFTVKVLFFQWKSLKIAEKHYEIQINLSMKFITEVYWFLVNFFFLTRYLKNIIAVYWYAFEMLNTAHFLGKKWSEWPLFIPNSWVFYWKSFNNFF